MYLRIFSFSGIEIYCMAIERPMVSLCSYESYICYVFHESPPFLGCQCLKANIFDTKSFSIKQQTKIPLSPYSTLDWLGFSQGENL